jgi:hypothetical protein
MIAELKKTYEYLPKADLELRRDIYITADRYGWEMVMILFIDGQRYATSHPITYEEYNSVAIDFEAYCIRELCIKMKDYLLGKGVIC